MLDSSVKMNLIFLIFVAAASFFFIEIKYEGIFVRSLGWAFGIFITPWYSVPLLAWAFWSRKLFFLWPAIVAFFSFLGLFYIAQKGVRMLGGSIEWPVAILGSFLASAIAVIVVQLLVSGILTTIAAIRRPK